MAKAKYHKSQRVFVKPVGTWACVEAVVPKWVKGCEEPIKVAYECGMGREFAQEELEEETTALQANAGKGLCHLVVTGERKGPGMTERVRGGFRDLHPFALGIRRAPL